jgi:hypothetical protein
MPGGLVVLSHTHTHHDLKEVPTVPTHAQTKEIRERLGDTDAARLALADWLLMRLRKESGDAR